MRLAAAILTLAAFAPAASLAAAERPDTVGRSFELVLRHESRSSDSKGGSGSSSGTDVLIETIVARTSEGTTIEYDDVTPEGGTDADGDWRFPARVFYPSAGGKPVLLDAETLAARNKEWLARNKVDPAACGSWIFTWNAFKIECDPLSVLELLPGSTMPLTGLVDGATVDSPFDGNTLVVRSVNAETFAATGAIDPEVVRQSRAESDVVVGEITRQPVTLDEALAKRAGDRIEGTFELTFEVGPGGLVTKRTMRTHVETTHPGGETESETDRSVLTRKDITEGAKPLRSATVALLARER